MITLVNLFLVVFVNFNLSFFVDLTGFFLSCKCNFNFFVLVCKFHITQDIFLWIHAFISDVIFFFFCDKNETVALSLHHRRKIDKGKAIFLKGKGLFNNIRFLLINFYKVLFIFKKKFCWYLYLYNYHKFCARRFPTN